MSPPTTLRIVEEGTKDYFKLHIKILRVCGISFNPNESLVYKLYSFMFLSTTIFVYTILDIHELFKHDFETSYDILTYVTGFLITVIKVIAMRLTRTNIQKVLTRLEQEPFLPNPNRGGEEENRLFRECMWKTNLQAQFYWRYAIVCVTAFSLYSFSKRIISNDYRKWLLPYGPLTVLDITHSPNYEITFFYQWICIGTLSAIYGTTDLIIAGVLAHISYQFKILQYFLRNIVEYSRKEMLKGEANISLECPIVEESRNHKITWKYLQKSIKEAVQYHVAIIELARDMEEAFRYMLLTTFLVTMASLCFEIYQLASENTGRDIRIIMEYLVGSVPIFILCYWGEEILTESGHVGAAAYDADFVGCDARFQKALEMIIRRSQIPTRLTAGKFADICLDTCLWIWRRSYTMCMVLRNTK